MALPSTALTFILTLILALIGRSTCHVLKGSVSCFDCDSRDDLAGIAVAVKCKHDTKRVTVLTDDGGRFEAQIPSNAPPSCHAKLLGGPKQFCSYRPFMISRAIKDKGSSHNYTFSTPLVLFSSCPALRSVRGGGEKAEEEAELGSSKTVDLPLPKEWGLPPPSFFVPFFPIIGIP